MTKEECNLYLQLKTQLDEEAFNLALLIEDLEPFRSNMYGYLEKLLSKELT